MATHQYTGARLFTALLALIFSVCFFADRVSATECQVAPSRWGVGQTIELHYKVKTGAVCSYQLSTNGLQFVGLDILDQPKGLIDIVSKPYSLAFRLKKSGKYTLKVRINVLDFYGKPGEAIFIFYIEAVPNEW